MLRRSNRRIKQVQAFDIKSTTRPELLAVTIDARRERTRVLTAGFRRAMRLLCDLPSRIGGRPTAVSRLA
jgi:hypothetical protein